SSGCVYFWEMSPVDVQLCSNCSPLLERPVLKDHDCPHLATVAPELAKRRAILPSDFEAEQSDLHKFVERGLLFPLPRADDIIDEAQKARPISLANFRQ